MAGSDKLILELRLYIFMLGGTSFCLFCCHLKKMQAQSHALPSVNADLISPLIRVTVPAPP